MPVFSYVAKDSEGRVVRGISDVESEDALRARLEGRGYKVDSIQPGSEVAQSEDVKPEEAAERVLKALLHDAVVRGYGRVELEIGEAETRKTRVEAWVTVGDERQNIMSVPHYVWPHLLQAVCEMACAPVPTEGSESGGYFTFEAHGKTIEVSFTASTTYISLEIVPTSD
jgi:hypothetical protein